MNPSTIAAIATPIGYGGIGIIRISGPAAFTTGAAIFRRHDKTQKAGFLAPPISELESHKLYYGVCINPNTQQIIDEILICFMRGPATYTKEDIVEIHSHGGPHVLHTILEILVSSGIRQADPGEFTKRAFLNGRIDLTQAEAVIDIIHAKSNEALALANTQIQGGIKNSIEELRNKLLDLQTRIELLIDFPEESGESPIIEPVHLQLLENIIRSIHALINNYDHGHFYRDGIKTVIAGIPNVGKSALMNRLLLRDRSIVTDIPGTTRDSIQDAFWFKGIPIIIIDTAGIQITDDPIEILGISKTRQHIAEADLILLVTEAHRELTNEEYQLYEQLKHKPIILVVNKKDRCSTPLPLVLPPHWKPFAVVMTSALYDSDMDELKAAIVRSSLTSPSSPAGVIVPNQRQAQALKNCLTICTAILTDLQNTAAIALIAIDIQAALRHLDEILGINVDVDVLDRIFSKFCIGK